MKFARKELVFYAGELVGVWCYHFNGNRVYIPIYNKAQTKRPLQEEVVD